MTCRIDPTTGLLAREECPEKLDELFISGTEPTEYCTAHGEVPPPGWNGPNRRTAQRTQLKS